MVSRWRGRREKRKIRQTELQTGELEKIGRESLFVLEEQAKFARKAPGRRGKSEWIQMSEPNKKNPTKTDKKQSEEKKSIYKFFLFKPFHQTN